MKARAFLVVAVLLAGWSNQANSGPEIPPPPPKKMPYEYPKSKITGPSHIVGKDIHGDPMPAGARARLGSIRLRHSDPVDHVVFSPDGKWLASYCSWEKSVKVWETATGKLRRHLHAADVVKMAFAPDGHALALILQTSAFTGEILVECRDLNTGKRTWLRAEDRHAEEGGLAFSPDGKRLYFGHAALRCFDPAGRKFVFPKQADSPIIALALAPDAATLVTAHEDGSVRFRDPHTGKERCRVDGVSASFLAFSADGKTLALATPDQVQSWQVPTVSSQTPKVTIQKRQSPMKEAASIIGLTFSPDAKQLLSLSDHGLACLWDVAVGKKLVRRQLSTSHVGAVAFYAGQRAMAVSTDEDSHGLRLWKVASGEELFADRHLSKRITCMTFSPDGRTLVTGSDNKVLRFWQTGSGEFLAKVQLPQVPSQIDFDPDGKHLIAGGKGKWWNIVLTKSAKDGAYLPVADKFAPLPKGSHWHRAANKSPKKNKLRGPIPWQIDLVAEGILMPDGLLLEWDRELIRVTENAGSGKTLFLVPFGKYYGAALAPNRRTIAVLKNEKDETVTLMNLELDWGKHLDFSRPPREPKEGLVKEALASGSSQRLDGWSLPLEEWLPDQPWLLPRIALVPGNRLLAVGSPRGSVLFWDLANSQRIYKIPGHEVPVSLLSFSPDGKTMACAYRDATVLLWHCPKLKEPRPTGQLPLEEFWQNLGSPEPPLAWRAHWSMVLGSTRTTSFLKERLQPVRRVDLGSLAQRIMDLDSDQFALRTKAMKEIEGMGLAAEPALFEELKKKTTLEKQRRLQQLLEKLDRAKKRQVQELRALAVLEQIATPEAMRLLEALAAGDPKAPLTIAARVSRKRLEK